MTSFEIMAAIDGIKDKLTDNEYLKLASLLKDKNEKEKKEYRIVYLSQKPIVKLDGSIKFHQRMKTKTKYMRDEDYEKCCNATIGEPISLCFMGKFATLADFRLSFRYNGDDSDGDYEEHKDIIYQKYILMSIKPVDDI